MSGDPGLVGRGEETEHFCGWLEGRDVGVWGRMTVRGDKSPSNFIIRLGADPTIWGFSSDIQIEMIKEEERHTLLHLAL